MNWLDFWKGCAFMAALVAAACIFGWLLALNPPLFFALLVLALILWSGLMAAKYGPPWA